MSKHDEMIQSLASETLKNIIEANSSVVSQLGINEAELQRMFESIAIQVGGNMLSEMDRDCDRAKQIVVNESAKGKADLKASFDAIVKDIKKMVSKEISSRVPQIVKFEYRGKMSTPKGLIHKDAKKVAKLVTTCKYMFMAGPTGSGKSVMFRSVAEIISYKFYDMSLGPSSDETSFFGYCGATGDYYATMLRKCLDYCNDNPKKGAVFCFDEIDAGSAEALVSLNGVLGNQSVTFPDGNEVKIPDNFIAVATANTFGTGATMEYCGRSMIDSATMNRFGTRLWVDYDKQLERDIVAQSHGVHEEVDRWVDHCNHCRQICMDNKFKVVISTRNIVEGAKLVASNEWTIQEAMELTFLFGIDDAIRSKLKYKAPRMSPKYSDDCLDPDCALDL